MNPIRKIVFFMGLARSKPLNLRINRQIGIIQPTIVATENNTIDKFNKVIIIRDGVEIYNNEIRWGRILKEYPYSEEIVTAIKKIHEIPIVERKIGGDIEFFQEKDFGSVETLI